MLPQTNAKIAYRISNPFSSLRNDKPCRCILLITGYFIYCDGGHGRIRVKALRVAKRTFFTFPAPSPCFQDT